MAAVGPPADIEPWYGPPRGFDFEREVQPVLDQHCVGCHDGRPDADGRPIVDLRSERFAAGYRRTPGKPLVPEPPAVLEPVAVSVPGWPSDAGEARRRQRRGGSWQQTIKLGPGVALTLVRIPAGSWVMGSNDGDADEYPPSRVEIPNDFWMGACEITNDQFRQSAPAHFSGCFMKRSLSKDGPGIDMDGPQQPVVRVSWQQAMAFCTWLSQRTGRSFSLPSEAQWEYACRAGTASPWSYGDGRADFSAHANVADACLPRIYDVTGGVVLLQDIPADARFEDGALVTAHVGSYEPNAWGLYDMHGNAAEWTRSAYRPYPYCDNDEVEVRDGELRVVRGGSFYDRPHRCRSSFRLSYPAWQRVHNVGFRVVCD